MNSRELLESMVKDEAARLNAGWTYEQDENGEYVDYEGNATSPHDFIAGALDIEYEVSCNLEYRGAKISTTIGGPAIWVEVSYPGTGYVHGVWGSDEFSAPYADMGELNSAAEEYYEMTANCR